MSSTDSDVGIATKKKSKTQTPKRFKVLLHNDDYTTMEFVVIILQKFFHLSLDEAKEIMLQIHNDGYGVAGIFTFEIAETKAAQVIRYSRQNGHPLRCTIEKE